MMDNTSRYLKMQKSENVKNGQIGPFSFVPTISWQQTVVGN
jgi:hypothetical protein